MSSSTFRKYRRYIISDFNLLAKITRIISYILIPNETYTTYYNLFIILKNKYGFISKIFCIYFNRASAKTIKAVFPSQSIWKRLKKYLCNESKFKNKTIELTFNLKRLCFIEPNNIYIIYKKIENYYSEDIYKDFFKYFSKTWNPKCTYKNLKIYPDRNYYNIVNSNDFDTKHLYL